MKKIYLTFLGLGIILVANSQNVEGFEGATGVAPDCWTSIDADGDGEDWAQISDPGAWPPHSGNGIFASSSWNGAPLTPDNYFILPQLDVQAGEDLSWWVAAQDPAYALENYSVVLSTTGDAEGDFSTELFTEVLQTNEWEERTVDLADYEGMQVYIAFRHHNVTDQFWMKIDDVSYPTTVDQCDIILDVEENTIQSLNLYPNPVTDVLNINTELNENKLVRITNNLGQVVLTQNFNSNQQLLQVDLSALSKGIYTVTITTSSAMSQGKVMVK